MNLYLLRVGADSTHYSRIFPDGSYIFIPIPDEEKYLVKEKARTYREYTWRNHPVCEYLPDRIQNRCIHNDPEFETFTYGSPRYNRNGSVEKNYRKLAAMQEGDMLTFYAAFTSNGHEIEGYYFFAYFIVDRPITVPDNLTDEEKELVENNHHFTHIGALQNQEQVIVKGCPKQSRLFRKAVLLSSHKHGIEGRNYRPCRCVQNLLGGYNKSMNRSSIRKIPLSADGICEFKNHLDKKGGRLQDA